MRNPTEKEKNLGIFHQMQTINVHGKIKRTDTQTYTTLSILPPAIMNLIGVYLLLPGKLDHLLALVIFLQQDSALNTPEIAQIKHALEEAISTNNFTSEYVDPIYNTTFTRIVELIGNRKEELLREAAKAGNELAVMQLLKIDGIHVNAKDNDGWTALMCAAYKGHTSVVTGLLNVDGILVNDKNNDGYNALMLAASNGHSSVVKELLNVDGIEVNAKHRNGQTALMFAADNGHTSVVTELLNVDGILVNAKGNHGWTALMLAGAKGYTSVVTALLNVYGILVNAKNNYGWTALMFAAIRGHTSVVTELLNADGILVNAQNNDGKTALMFAAIFGHTSVVYQLCAKQLFDAPYGQCSKLFQQLTNEVKSANNSMTINPTSLCANFLVSISALPAPDVKIALLEKALSGMNAFSALMQNEQRLQIEAALTKLKSSQKAQSSNNPQFVIFSGAPVPSSSSSNTAHASLRLISNQ